MSLNCFGENYFHVKTVSSVNMYPDSQLLTVRKGGTGSDARWSLSPESASLTSALSEGLATTESSDGPMSLAAGAGVWTSCPVL